MAEIAGANISTGQIGSGEAQILGDGGLLNMYSAILAKQQLRRQQEQQQLANELSKVKVDGVRQADQQEYFNQYQALKNTAAKIPYEKDGWKRAQMKANVDQQFLQLQQFANNSKTFGKQYTDLKGKLLDNRFRDQFSDDAVAKVSAADALPMSHPQFIKDFTGLERVVDAEKLGKEVDAIDKNLLNKSQWSNQIGKPAKLGNRSGYFVNSTRQVSPEEQLTAYANKYTVDPTFRKFLQQTYPDQDLSDPNVKAVALKDFADKRRATGTLSENSKPEFKENRVDNYYAHFDYRQSHKGEGDSDNASTHRQKVIAGLMNNDGRAFEELKSYLPADSKVSFKTSVKKDGVSKGGYNLIQVDIPNRIVGDQIVPGIKKDISLTNGDAQNALNAILNQYSGEKISASKMNTQGGKPRGADVELPKTPKATVNSTKETVTYNGKSYGKDAVAKAAAASGMTVQQYLKAISK